MEKDVKVILACPKCKSSCLWHKPDGSILCTVCMTTVKEGTDNETKH
jgi:uncharacterized Zn finger protein (UPF0148 family)